MSQQWPHPLQVTMIFLMHGESLTKYKLQYHIYNNKYILCELKSHVIFILHSPKVMSETDDIVKEGVAHCIDDMADPENVSDGECQFLPFIRTMQRIVLYMTKSRIYIVGSNNMQTKFRVLKIDRTEPRALKISDDKQVYSQKEVN